MSQNETQNEITMTKEYNNDLDFSVKDILEAIEDSFGIVNTIAGRLGCSWNTARDKIQKHEATRIAFDNEREKILDVSEGVVLNEIINKKNEGTAKWVLSRLGKKRGFAEKVEMEDTTDYAEQKRKIDEYQKKFLEEGE